MSNERMAELTEDEIRSIAAKAVADVARNKITTTKTEITKRAIEAGAKYGYRRTGLSIQGITKIREVQKKHFSEQSLNGWFNDAFNQIRKAK